MADAYQEAGRDRDAELLRDTGRKVPLSQQNRRKAIPKLVPAEEYTPHTYTHAIRVAARKAAVPHWHPNQLRHTFATEVRREFGPEAAQVLLGHSHLSTTEPPGGVRTLRWAARVSTR